MAPASLGTVVRELRLLTRPPYAGAVSDAELLERFSRTHDQAAFALLVERHGRLVWGVCRHVLGHEQDAEDAFQATFLILAQKAASIRTHTAVGAWLHGAAYRSALQVKRKAARRRAHENQAHNMAKRNPPCEVTWRELQAVLDEEIQRLPENQRIPFVLCCLEGKSKAEAARELGWKEGTVSGRLARARSQLQKRLSRRGVALSAVLGALALTQAAAAAVPAALVQVTIRSAVEGVAADLVSAEVGAVVRAVGRTLFFTRLKTAALVTFLLSMTGLGAALFGQHTSAEEPPPEPKAATPALAEAPRTPSAGDRPATDRYGDPLPPGARLRLGTVRFQHGKATEAMVLSPDGKLLVTGGVNALRVWDTATGRPLHHHEHVSIPHGMPGEGRSFIAIRPHERTLACIGEHGVRFWELDTGKELPAPVGAGGCSVAFSSDGRLLATAAEGGPAHVYELATGRERFQVSKGGLVAFAPDGRSLVVYASHKNGVSLVSAEDGTELRRFSHGAEVHRAAFAPDGRLLATAGQDGIVRLWETATGRGRHTLDHLLTGTQKYIPALAFAPDGKVLATGAQDNRIRLWEVETGKEVRRLSGHSNCVTGLAFAPDGRTLYSASWDRHVKRWDPRAGRELPVTAGASDYLFASLSGDGRLLASGGGADGLVHLTEVATGRRVRTFRGPRGACHVFALAPDAKLLAAGLDGTVRLWDVATGREVDVLGEPAQGPSPPFQAVAFAPDGRTLATVRYGENKARLWDVATGKVLREFAHSSGSQLAFAPDGRALAVGGWDGTITVWDPETGRKHFDIALPGNSGIVDGMAFAPDGRTLANGDHEGVIHLWNAHTGNERRRWRTDQGVLWSLAYTPDGLELISAGADGSLRLWDPATGQELLRRDGHKGWALTVSCGRDGRTVVTSSMDNTVLVWDLRPATQPLPAGGATALWKPLADGGLSAYHATWALIDHPTEAVAFLTERMGPARVVAGNEEQVGRWLADLDSDKFAVRQAATDALARQGTAVESRLQKALAATSSEEVRRRLQTLLDGLARLPEPANVLRDRRAVRVLEQVRTPEARRLLRRLAEGSPRAPLTREAKAALRRMEED